MSNGSLPDIYPNSIGDEIYSDFSPFVDKYGDPDSSLAVYLHALASMYQPIDDICKDGPNDEPGWSQIFDLSRAKTEWLPWIGNITGYQVPIRPRDQSLADYDAAQRERLVSRSTWRRGSVAMLVETVQEHLGGQKRVTVQERYNNDAYMIRVVVFQSEIATSYNELRTAALKQKVAGLIMYIDSVTGSDYATLRGSQSSYGVVTTKFTDYNEVFTNPAKP